MQVKNVILVTIVIQFILTSITALDVNKKYLTKDEISLVNRPNRVTSTTQSPKGLVLVSKNEIIWKTYNNPINKPIIKQCYLTPKVVKKLQMLRSKINFRIVNCYISENDRNYILNNLNRTFIDLEYGKGYFDEVKYYLSIDRSSGNIVDIEVLDDQGNKAYRNNKYLNLKSYKNSWDISDEGFSRVTKYPWMWKL